LLSPFCLQNAIEAGEAGDYPDLLMHLPAESTALLSTGCALFSLPLQYAIEAAEAGDYSELDRLMQVLANPYDEQPEADPKYSSKPPPEMVRPGVCVLSCSS
jgi:hypothetical protein